LLYGPRPSPVQVAFNPATARRRASNLTASKQTPITVNDNTVVIVPSA
jgi:hypothetical protein